MLIIYYSRYFILLLLLPSLTKENFYLRFRCGSYTRCMITMDLQGLVDTYPSVTIVVASYPLVLDQQRDWLRDNGGACKVGSSDRKRSSCDHSSPFIETMLFLLRRREDILARVLPGATAPSQY